MGMIAGQVQEEVFEVGWDGLGMCAVWKEEIRALVFYQVWYSYVVSVHHE